MVNHSMVFVCYKIIELTFKFSTFIPVGPNILVAQFGRTYSSRTDCKRGQSAFGLISVGPIQSTRKHACSVKFGFVFQDRGFCIIIV